MTVNFENDTGFCVYLHKDEFGVVRYVGEGRLKRAYHFSRTDQPAWLSLFKDKKPTVEIVANNLTKIEAEKFEWIVRDLYKDSIINNPCARKTHKQLNFDLISEWVYYDETSPSFLRWKKDTNNPRSPKDSVAGYLAKGHHYYSVEIQDVLYTVSRIVYLINHGNFDSLYFVDHIDGNKQNNNIRNLRLVTAKENSHNKLCKIPKTGFRYIRFQKGRKGDVIGYTVRWTNIESGERLNENFYISNFDSEKDCLISAYLFRDSLIESGAITKRVKEGEICPL